MSFIAGPYTMTLNALSLGMTEDAPRLEVVNSQAPIVGDNMGDSFQDGVFRGGNCFLDCVLQEYNAAGALTAFWPFAATWGEVGQSGVLSSAKATALIMTAVAGTTATPATLTFAKACLAPGFPVSMLFGSRLRNVPVRFQMQPTQSGSPAAMRWWV